MARLRSVSLASSEARGQSLIGAVLHRHTGKYPILLIQGRERRRVRRAGRSQRWEVKIGAGGRCTDPADPDECFMLDLVSALAVRESGATSKRIRRAVRSRAAEGQPHGKIPYGYRREHDPATGATLRQVPDETTAPVVWEIARRLCQVRGAIAP